MSNSEVIIVIYKAAWGLEGSTVVFRNVTLAIGQTPNVLASHLPNQESMMDDDACEKDLSHSLSLLRRAFISPAHLGFGTDFNSGLTQGGAHSPVRTLACHGLLVARNDGLQVNVMKWADNTPFAEDVHVCQIDLLLCISPASYCVLFLWLPAQVYLCISNCQLTLI